MLQAAVMMALAVQTGAAEPQGPPSTTPLTAQSGATPPSPTGPLANSTGKAQLLTSSPVEGQASAGVTAYPASFFTPFQPNTATDMLSRVPGFVLDDGGDVRGFADAVGNVLIDGQRPSSKSDDLEQVLRRIPASQVERIDLIRGGAPGIDMQGKTVVANIIRKQNTGVTGVVTLSDGYLPKDGRQTPRMRIELQDRKNGTSLEASFTLASFYDDGAGDGPETETAPDGTRLYKSKDNTAGGGGQSIATLTYSTPAFGGTLKLNGQLFGQTYLYDERDQDVTSLLDPPAIEHDHGNQERSEFGATYDRSFGAQLSTETLFIQQFQAEDYLTLYQDPGDMERFREGHVNGESILRSTATYALSPALQLQAGAEADYNWLDARNTYVDNAVLIQLPAADVDITETRGEVFGKATWILNPQVHRGGSACDWKASQHQPPAATWSWARRWCIPKPRARLHLVARVKADQFRVRIERGGQPSSTSTTSSPPPALTTGQIYVGNPNLNASAGDWCSRSAYERRFWKTGDVSFTYRHSDLTDVIDRAPVIESNWRLRLARPISAQRLQGRIYRHLECAGGPSSASPAG